MDGGGMTLDPVKFTRALVEKVKSAIAPLEDRITALEQFEPVHGKDGAPGLNGKDGAEGLPGKDGAQGLQGKDGADGLNGKDGADGRDGIDGKDGAPGHDGIDGKDGKDGISVTMDDVAPLVEAQVAKAVAAVPAAKDGAPGHDGANGKDGRDGLPGVPGLTGEKGIDGTDGKDGLGFDDVQVEHDGHGGFTLKFIRGDRSKTFGVFQVPRFEYHGVWTPKQYEKGDGVTWAGSLWIAKTTTSMKPGDGSDGWQLAVKRGADGKNGK
jgi:integrin beta 3